MRQMVRIETIRDGCPSRECRDMEIGELNVLILRQSNIIDRSSNEKGWDQQWGDLSRR